MIFNKNVIITAINNFKTSNIDPFYILFITNNPWFLFKQMKKESYQIPVFVLGLLFGASSTLLIKATYDIGAIDPLTGLRVPYEKPIFLTFLMFVAMSLALPLHVFLTRNDGKKSAASEDGTKQENTPLLNNPTTYPEDYNYSPSDPFGDKQYDLPNNDQQCTEQHHQQQPQPFKVMSLELARLLMAPSWFDLLGTALSTIGLLYVPVSLYQLARCAVIIVTAVFKRVLLKHHLTTAMYAGVAINAAAMVVVGAAAILLGGGSAEGLAQGAAEGTKHSTSDIITGLTFIFSSCIVQAAQYVYEEKVMDVDDIPPLVLVGWEGVNGALMSLFISFPFAILMPGSDNGHYEDIWSAFTLPFSSPRLSVVLLMFFIVIFAYNVFCIYITFLLNSVYHAVMDNMRPAAVTVFGLFFYYTFGIIGEPWSAKCWFELVAMLMMFLGTLTYSGKVELPCIPPEKKSVFDDQEEEEEVQVPFIRDTPVLHARKTTAVLNNGEVDVTQMLTQSPALNAMAAHHGHSHHHHHHHQPQHSSRQPQGQYGSTML